MKLCTRCGERPQKIETEEVGYSDIRFKCACYTTPEARSREVAERYWAHYVDLVNNAEARVVGGLHYDPSQSILLASDAYWDGMSTTRNGSNTYLFRTKRGRYFQYFRDINRPHRSRVSPLEKREAQSIYEALDVNHQPFAEAFPDAAVVEA